MSSFSKKTIETSIDPGIKTYVMPTGAKDVITIAGSIVGGAIHCTKKNSKTALITASMLDKGAAGKTKHEISNRLESVGAEIHFSSDQYRTFFTAHCLSGDLEIVISLLAEQLKNPSFVTSELSTLKTRMIGSLKREKENTKKRASIEFSQLLFPQFHPNHRTSIEDSIQMVEKTNKEDIKKFHEKIYGTGSMSIVAVGDIEAKMLEKAIIENFSSWRRGSASISKTKEAANTIAFQNKKINVPEKTSADVYIGQPIGIDRNHEDHYPLMIAIYILGGNFSARLMQTVRDQQGLTYGIGSSVSGVEYGTDGYWSTWGTFAPEIINKGIDATIDQIKKWHHSGVTEEELLNKKTTISGSYKVGMDTTGGIAAQILNNAERGKKLSYLDSYPDVINSITLNQVNEAIKKYIHPKKLITVAAGTFN